MTKAERPMNPIAQLWEARSANVPERPEGNPVERRIFNLCRGLRLQVEEGTYTDNDELLQIDASGITLWAQMPLADPSEISTHTTLRFLEKDSFEAAIHVLNANVTREARPTRVTYSIVPTDRPMILWGGKDEDPTTEERDEPLEDLRIVIQEMDYRMNSSPDSKD